MIDFLPDLSPDNTVKPVFNPADFDYKTKNVTYGDLLNYAHKYGYNNFTGLNDFTVLQFNESLNGVDPQTFSYLSNVDEDIQDQFNDLFRRTTAQSYNNGITLIDSVLATPIINLNNRNLETRLITDENDISQLKTKTTALTYDGSFNSFSSKLLVPALTLNGTDLNTRLNADESLIGINTNNINTLQTQVITLNEDVSMNTFDISQNKTNISYLQNQVSNNTNAINDISNNMINQLSGVVKTTGNQYINGQKTFYNTPKVGTVYMATINDISTAITNLIAGAPSTMDTLNEISQILSQDVSAVSIILKTMVDISSSQVISGQKTFSTTQTFNDGLIATQLAQFTDISANNINFTGSLNNISSQTFNYISGLTSNVQSQLNALSSLVTNITYDTISNTTKFMSSVAIPTLVSNDIYTNNVTSNSVLTNNVDTNTITCHTLKTFVPLPYPVVFLYNQGVTFPLLATDLGLVSNLTGLNITQVIAVTILPNYKFSFLNSDKSTILHIQNDTGDVIYNVAYQFTDPPVYYKITRINM